MHRIKKLLKVGLANNAHFFEIKVGRYPIFYNKKGSEELTELGVYDQGSLLDLARYLFPNQAITTRSPVRGKLSITDSSSMLMLLNPLAVPMTLKIFAGVSADAMFQKAWAEIINQPISAITQPTNIDQDAKIIAGKPAVGANLFSEKTNDIDFSGANRNHSISPPVSPAGDTEAIGLNQSNCGLEDEPSQTYIVPSVPIKNIVPPKIALSTDVTEYDDDLFGPDDAKSEQLLPLSSPDLTTSPAYYQKDNEPKLPGLGNNDSVVYPPQRIPDLPIKANLSHSGMNENSDASYLSDEISQDVEKMPTIPITIHYGAFTPGEIIKRGLTGEIDRLLEEMVEKKASDLHLTLNEVLAFRIDGEVIKLDKVIPEEMMKRLLDGIIPPRNRQEFVEKNDTDFAYEVDGVGRFRVNLFRDRHGVGAVLRHIPSQILSAEQLGLSAAIRAFCQAPKGLVLVTGPTGSGKSTTLAAMVDLINESRRQHIITIEDPIEFVYQQKKSLVRQRQVHRHTTSFSQALRAALREDPDIVLIGELRDLETIAIALETAETGHLVFGTLHTNSAVATVNRIIDQFPSDQQSQIKVMLAESLNGVVAQMLLKKKGGGRVAAHEILVVNHAVRSNIREGKTKMIPTHMQTQKSEGNILMNESLLNLVKQGIVEPIEAYSKSSEKEELVQMFRNIGITLKPQA